MEKPGTSITSGEPSAISCKPVADQLARDQSEAGCEEIEFSLAKEGNMTVNGIVLMICGGMVAALAGVILTVADRSVLTAGAMIGLALVPAGAACAMGLAAGDFEVMRAAVSRWATQVGIVVALATAVFFWKRLTVQKRTVINS